MSEMDAEGSVAKSQADEQSKSQAEGSKMEDDEEEYDQEQSADEDDIFKNNHDLIGVQGILKAQKTEIDKKKLELRMENERYIRSHHELNYILQLFVAKILDDRPENILEYAGTFFDSAGLRDQVKKYTQKEMDSADKQKYLSDLIKGKTLI